MDCYVVRRNINKILIDDGITVYNDFFFNDISYKRYSKTDGEYTLSKKKASKYKYLIFYRAISDYKASKILFVHSLNEYVRALVKLGYTVNVLENRLIKFKKEDRHFYIMYRDNKLYDGE